MSSQDRDLVKRHVKPYLLTNSLTVGHVCGLCGILQCLWRCYAAESRSHCYATWRIHVQDSSSAGHHHHPHAHLARTLGRLGWRSSAAGGGRSRKAFGGGGGLGGGLMGGVGRRGARFTLVDGTAVAMALMCQTAEVRGDASVKNSSRDNMEQSSSNVFQPTQRECNTTRRAFVCVSVCVSVYRFDQQGRRDFFSSFVQAVHKHTQTHRRWWRESTVAHRIGWTSVILVMTF